MTGVGGVTASWIGIISGHAMEGLSTLWHYINPSAAMLVPGATILGGWPGLPHGQLGMGAKPASLVNIVMAGAASMAQLDDLVDIILQLKPGFVDPELLGEGALRPLARAMGATVIMYYRESWDASEVIGVTTRMRAAMISSHLATSDAEAHHKLLVWCAKLQEAFDVANLHLVHKAAHADTAQLVCLMQRLAKDLGEISKVVKDGAKDNASLKDEMSSKLQDMR